MFWQRSLAAISLRSGLLHSAPRTILNISGRAGKFFMTLLPTYQISLLWGLDWWQGKDKQRFGLVGPARAEKRGR